MLLRASSVKRRAAILRAGSSKVRVSLVTVPTITAILPILSSPFMNLARRDVLIGALLVLDILRRLTMVAANLESARRDKKLFGDNMKGTKLVNVVVYKTTQQKTHHRVP